MIIKSYAVWIRAAIILGGLFLLSQVTAIYLPVILATILAFILNPLVNFICRTKIWPMKGNISRTFAIVAALICAGAMMAFAVSFILMPVVHEFNKFALNLPELILKVQSITTALGEKASTANLPDNARNLIEQSVASMSEYSVGLARRILNAIFGFASQVVELVVLPVLTYYFLKDWQKMKEDVVSAFSSDVAGRLRSVIEEMAAVISAYIRAQALISIIMGLLVFSGMYFFQVEYPLVLGLLATITETIPVIGPIIGAVPAILLAYLASPALAVKVIIFYIVIHQIENHIIVPKIMGHHIDLHPVIVIISLLIGAQLMGVVGMMLAVPVAALSKVLIKHLWYYNER